MRNLRRGPLPTSRSWSNDLDKTQGRNTPRGPPDQRAAGDASTVDSDFVAPRWESAETVPMMRKSIKSFMVKSRLSNKVHRANRLPALGEVVFSRTQRDRHLFRGGQKWRWPIDLRAIDSVEATVRIDLPLSSAASNGPNGPIGTGQAGRGSMRGRRGVGLRLRFGGAQVGKGRNRADNKQKHQEFHGQKPPFKQSPTTLLQHFALTNCCRTACTVP